MSTLSSVSPQYIFAQVLPFDSQAREVFNVLGRWMRIDLQDLERETGFDRTTVKDKLAFLKRENLIGEVEAPIEDFALYYLTPLGVGTYTSLLARAPGPSAR